jgi:hypothetical protein
MDSDVLDFLDYNNNSKRVVKGDRIMLKYLSL